VPNETAKARRALEGRGLRPRPGEQETLRGHVHHGARGQGGRTTRRTGGRSRRGHRGDETVLGWSNRWLVLRPRQKESTNAGYREQVRRFVREYGHLRLRDVTVELALEWARDHRWCHGGIRAMFSDARRADLIEQNPFAGLRLAGTRGRKDLDVLTRAEVERLAECATEVWSGEVALSVRALVLSATFVGMRPAELYGLRWSDLDLRNDEIRVERQYSPKSRRFELPKNGLKRTIVLTSPAKAALLDLPRPVNADQLIFRGSRGGPLTGRTQHYYWHPVRCRFGLPSMDLYELRHFCGAWLFNDLGPIPVGRWRGARCGLS
jgi:integrase